MKLLVLTTSFPRNKQDYKAYFILDLVKRLNAKKLLVLTPHSPNSKFKEEIEQIKVKRFVYFLPTPMEKLTSLSGIVPALKNSFFAKIQFPILIFFYFINTFLKSFSFGIIYANWLLSAFVALPSKFLLKKPIVLTLRGSDIDIIKGKGLFSLVGRFVLHNVNHAICLSQDLKEDLIRIGFKGSKVQVIPNGVDIIKDIPKKEIRKKLNLNEKHKIVLFIGRIIKDKGVSYLIDAAKKLDNKNIDFILLGGGDKLKAYKQLIEDYKLKNVFFIGAIKHNLIPHWISAADIFILPSLHEGGSNVILESMAGGKAIITTEVGWAKDFLTDKKSCLFIRPRNSEDIVNAISYLIKKPGEINRLGNNARRIITKKQLTWDSTVEKYLNIFNKFKK